MSTTRSPVTALTELHLEPSYPSSNTARVAVVGEVDLATSQMLRDQLLSLLRERAPAVLDVDLAGVPFLDCSGVSALVAGYDAAVQSGLQMRVTHPQPMVRRVLELTGLLGVLTGVESP